MSAPTSMQVAAAGIGVPLPAHTPQTVAAAAKQFEALIIAQILKEARGDEGGWLGSEGDAGSATAAGLAEEQFAQALAQNGGLGLATQIASSLSARAK